MSNSALRLLYTELSMLDPVKILEDQQRMQIFRNTLCKHVWVYPGFDAKYSTYWLFPVIFNEPKKALFALWMRGIPAMAGYQVHQLVRSHKHASEEALEAEKTLNKIILLPVNSDTPDSDIKIIKEEIFEFVHKLYRELPIPTSNIIAKL